MDGSYTFVQKDNNTDSKYKDTVFRTLFSQLKKG